MAPERVATARQKRLPPCMQEVARFVVHAGCALWPRTSEAVQAMSGPSHCSACRSADHPNSIGLHVGAHNSGSCGRLD